ncbi:MAG: hypothetical protein L6Q99_13550 [Planctomycetes bacterium]|nr:hypothetical protein [Planctomycetota bacterium]
MKHTLQIAAFIAVSSPLVCACSASPAATSATGATATPTSTAPAQKSDARSDAQRAGKAPKVEWTQAELEELSRTIQAQVADLRGAAFDGPVAVRLADKDQFFAYAKERQSLTETPEKIAADETIAKLLGAFPPELDLMATTMEFLKDQVGGFYDPASNSFSLMDQCPKGVAKIVLAHELGHALDDQLYSLDARMTELAKNSDASFAYAAVVEGSGTAVMTRWTLAHMSEVGADMAGLAEMQEDANESMAKAPMWLWKPLIAVYLQGASFLARSSSLMAGQSGGAKNEDIDAAFKNPPRSMEQVLHPEKYWNDEKRDEPLHVAFDASKLEDGWSVHREDTLGEFFLAILATPPAQRTSPDLTNPMALLGMKFTNDVGRGWGGDRVALLGKDKARYLRVVTRWDTPRDAAEFFGAMTMLVPDLERSAKAFAELAGAPSADEADAKLESGAEVEYGKEDAVVTLSIWSRVPARDRRMIEKRLGVSFDPK